MKRFFTNHRLSSLCLCLTLAMACAPDRNLEDPNSRLATVDIGSFPESIEQMQIVIHAREGEADKPVVDQLYEERQLKGHQFSLEPGLYNFRVRLFKDNRLSYDSSACQNPDYLALQSPPALVSGRNQIKLVVCSVDDSDELVVIEPPTEDAELELEIVPEDQPAKNMAGIAIDGRQLLVNGKSYRIKGVCWNPVPLGERHPRVMFNEPARYQSELAHDIKLMTEAGINTVRTYVPITDKGVLDNLHQAGIRVIVPFFGNQSSNEAIATVHLVKDHPAILMYEVGNEWNYNHLYSGLNFDEALEKVGELARAIKGADPSRPVATSFGELPEPHVLDGLPDIDIWGLNVYAGKSFADRFARWQALSQKPMYFSEFGADAYDSVQGAANPMAQAEATEALLIEIRSHGAYGAAQPATIGGTIFEWNDEWWKNDNPDQQDLGGVAPGGGPWPDFTFNEEWWGLVTLDRKTRPAYDRLKKIYRSWE
ncbi:glycoside hydrolase family 2 TIM barrel-domain containing protein [Pseudobacteriovorax antillogorgiicola]|uniref:Glycosyl hydrolases family 2, TIM barrel domain n=1 Tax=Pseudobacteriovorax antillogorgiicola TaxID=1513793 RepID=A0A1Y6BFN1_9BACT|nr:glycoside hydrolase family 2 TIM barrel-domain containing protein [Pseudobacteriovorax antillogorgiicola]TCS57439.1 glycosyl hydrolase family 2 [Pseudobacteriovorax antillogorgiicola]SMF01057.1 Glycosyl hydrolases family 2, TIM barrel domain [Pseudobacteriovorax antillogorgiicola]